MRYSSEYQGLESSDSIIEALEERYEGRVCDEGSGAHQQWSDPEDLNGIVERAWELAEEGEDELFWGVESFSR